MSVGVAIDSMAAGKYQEVEREYNRGALLVIRLLKSTRYQEGRETSRLPCLGQKEPSDVAEYLA